MNIARNSQTFLSAKSTNTFSTRNIKGNIYSLGRKLDLELCRLDRVSNENKERIKEFYNYCLAQGLSKHRILTYLIVLRGLDFTLKMPFRLAKKEDLIRVIAHIENNGYSNHTKTLYKAVIKKFWKWLKDLDYYPVQVKWIRSSSSKKRLLPEELLTMQEVERLVEFADNIKDKAMVSVLYESGMRVGELLNLKIKNVQFDEYGAILIVCGKTGYRRVRIVKSARFLKRWIKLHPMGSNPSRGDSSLFFRKYASFMFMLRRLAEKSRIKKRVNPHSFRHSRSTYLSNFLTESQLCEYLGWVQGSNMPRVYVHLSGRDIDKAILKLNGINLKEQPVKVRNDFL